MCKIYGACWLGALVLTLRSGVSGHMEAMFGLWKTHHTESYSGCSSLQWSSSIQSSLPSTSSPACYVSDCCHADWDETGSLTWTALSPTCSRNPVPLLRLNPSKCYIFFHKIVICLSSLSNWTVFTACVRGLGNLTSPWLASKCKVGAVSIIQLLEAFIEQKINI